MIRHEKKQKHVTEKKKKKVRWSTDPEWVQRADEDFKAAITNMYVGLKKMS